MASSNLPIEHDRITPPSNDHLQENVEARLKEDPHINDSEITVEVKEGVVILSGTVINDATRVRAETVVEDVPGVFEVHNHIVLESAVLPADDARH